MKYIWFWTVEMSVSTLCHTKMVHSSAPATYPSSVTYPASDTGINWQIRMAAIKQQQYNINEKYVPLISWLSPRRNQCYLVCICTLVQRQSLPPLKQKDIKNMSINITYGFIMLQ